MPTKKVALSTKPEHRAETPSAEQWVASRATEETKRLTIDLPASLHARIKASCALRGVKMVDEIRALLEERFSEIPRP